MDANKAAVIITSTLSIVALTLLLNAQTKRVEKLVKANRFEKLKGRLLAEMLLKNIDMMDEEQLAEFNKIVDDERAFVDIINHIK